VERAAAEQAAAEQAAKDRVLAAENAAEERQLQKRLLWCRRQQSWPLQNRRQLRRQLQIIRRLPRSRGQLRQRGHTTTTTRSDDDNNNNKDNTG